MSLEAALASLTAAVEANTAALESIQASGADPAVEAAAERRGPGRPPAYTLEAVRVAVRKFADVKGTVDQEKRKNILIKLLASVGEKNLKEMDPKKYNKFMAGLKKQEELLEAVGDDSAVDDVDDEAEGDW